METRFNRLRLISGSITFGLLWAGAVLAAVGTAPEGIAIGVPAAGAFGGGIYGMTRGEVAAGTFGLISGLGQAAGLGLFISAFTVPDEILVREGKPGHTAAGATAPSFQVAPRFGAGELGLTSSYAF
ncbi:MAG: hypothetical protein AAF928_18960 [Myxococcota bacterium]